MTVKALEMREAGCGNYAIASTLGVSPATIYKHLGKNPAENTAISHSEGRSSRIDAFMARYEKSRKSQQKRELNAAGFPDSSSMTVNRIRAEIVPMTRSERLSERKEQAIQLHREGYSHREIAEKLGVSVQSVYRYLADTRQVREKPRKALNGISDVDSLVSEITKQVIASLIQVLSESIGRE